MVFLKILNVLVIDEFGLIVPNILGMLIIILQHIRNNELICKSILIFDKMDTYQLLPVKGISAILSILVITEFEYTELTQSVQAANDFALQKIQTLTRTIDWNRVNVAQLKQLSNEIFIFVELFDDPRLTYEVVFVFDQKVPCMATKIYT